MSTLPALTPRPAALAERLNAARRRRFVGRAAELDLFRAAILEPEPAFAVLFVHGPGGVGKTSLLAAYADLAAAAGVATVRLDARNLEPSPPVFVSALAQALGATAADTPFDCLRERPRTVLFLDTYEAIAPLDPWLREEFLPRLPQQHLVVIAGRQPPTAAWRSDPGWQEIVRVLSLRNLRPEESRGYLRARGVPDERHQTVIDLTHGHPLALSLVADALAQGDELAWRAPAHEPDVVRVLLERFVEHVPSPAHRLALDACAHVRVMNESMLAVVLDTGDEAHAIFEWLRGLSFIEQGPEGLFPHDLARDVLDADLRWRNRDAYRRLHHRVRGDIVSRLQETHGVEQQRAVFDLLFLHRTNPIMKPLHEWSTLGAAYLEPAGPADEAAILAAVASQEGEASVPIAAYWFQRQPEAFTLFRRPGREILGFCANLVLGEPDARDLAADPAIEPAWAFARRFGPVRPGEVILHQRFIVLSSGDQTDPVGHNMAAVNSLARWISTPNLAWNFLTVSDPEYWQQMFAYIDMRRATEADFAVGDRRYAVFAHDWRATPLLTWLELMGEREIAEETELAKIEANRATAAPLLVLSRPQFDEAVRLGLRNLARPDQLAANPLLRSRLVVERATTAPPVATLQSLLREAVDRLAVDPRDAKLYRAIRRTYLEPTATQELAAESLGLPFNTYRYHLNSGIRRVADWLWLRELHGLEG